MMVYPGVCHPERSDGVAGAKSKDLSPIVILSGAREAGAVEELALSLSKGPLQRVSS